MNIVDSLATSSNVLRVNGSDGISSRSDAEYQWVLLVSLQQEIREGQLTLAFTGSVYSVLRCTTKCSTDCLCSCCNSPWTMNGSLGSRSPTTDRGTFLMMIVTRVPGFSSAFTQSLAKSAHLNTLLDTIPFNPPLCTLIILKLEDLGVINR